MLANLVQILRVAAKTPAGKYLVRVARGLSHHSAHQYALRGVSRVVGSYERLNPLEKEVVNEIVAISTRAALNYAEDEFTLHLPSADAIEREADSIAKRIVRNFLNALQSRAQSSYYDGCFGGIQRDGRIFVEEDIIKQCVIAAFVEIVESHRS